MNTDKRKMKFLPFWASELKFWSRMTINHHRGFLSLYSSFPGNPLISLSTQITLRIKSTKLLHIRLTIASHILENPNPHPQLHRKARYH
jgi:hypothetical protein